MLILKKYKDKKLLENLQNGDTIFTVFIPNDPLKNDIIINKGCVNNSPSFDKLLEFKCIIPIQPLGDSPVLEKKDETDKIKLYYYKPQIIFQFIDVKKITRISNFDKGKLFVSTSKKHIIDAIYENIFQPLIITIGNNQQSIKIYKEKLHSIINQIR